MPSLAQLQAEAAWIDEFIPAPLVQLRQRLADHFNVPLTNIGMRGDTNHLSGYHRSRRWIKTSVWCVSRTYSVSRTPGDRSGGDSNAVSAMDITLPGPQLIAMCKRLDVAVRAGRLEKITEWYGNTDGDTRVDGYDNISNRVASSDPSHLWHAHLSFDRGRVAEDHDDLYKILTGVDDVSASEVWNYNAGSSNNPVTTVARLNQGAKDSASAKAGVDQLLARPPVEAAPVDPAALKAVMLDPEVVAAYAKAINDDAAARLAD